MTEISFTVPLTPPSVNHYARHTRTGRHYVTAEAKAYKAALTLYARHQTLCGGKSEAGLRKLRYELSVTVYLAKDQRLDGDNAWKVVADGLKDAGAIHSDAAVTDWIMRVRRDWENPRTEIIARAI